MDSLRSNEAMKLKSRIIQFGISEKVYFFGFSWSPAWSDLLLPFISRNVLHATACCGLLRWCICLIQFWQSLTQQSHGLHLVPYESLYFESIGSTSVPPPPKKNGHTMLLHLLNSMLLPLPNKAASVAMPLFRQEYKRRCGLMVEQANRELPKGLVLPKDQAFKLTQPLFYICPPSTGPVWSQANQQGVWIFPFPFF